MYPTLQHILWRKAAIAEIHSAVQQNHAQVVLLIVAAALQVEALQEEVEEVMVEAVAE